MQATLNRPALHPGRRAQPRVASTRSTMAALGAALLAMLGIVEH